jgi:hypothetical protein
MYEMTDDIAVQPDEPNTAPDAAGVEDAEASQRDKALVAEIIKTIKGDRLHHKRAYERMRRDMQIATWGSDKTWGQNNYRANIAGRHVKMKTAALYAKNPKAVAKRRDTMDFAVWDENPSSLQLAFQTVQLATQAAQVAASQPPQMDPVTGVAVPVQPQLPPGTMEAQAVLQDFQQGMARRQELEKYGKTLERLFSYYMGEQKPVDFKRGMKQLVRRTCTTGVGYIELGFQRETGPRPGLTEELADARTRLDHLRNLAKQAAEGEIESDDSEMAELEHSIEQLMQEPEIVLREGLIVDFPQSTKVIPDRLCKQLDGFVGARHMAIEYTYTVEEVQELFDVDLRNKYTSYNVNSGSSREISSDDVLDDDYEWTAPDKKKNGLVCVWKYYDKPSGLVYIVADGYPNFLRKPAAPDVFVEDFWPLYALTFNAVENDEELFPPSDVTLLLDMQKEYNRSRQGLREHRDAARPRWVFPNGIFDEEDPMMMRNLRPFEALGLNIDPQTDIKTVLQTLPVPGVDPNLYETGQYFTDMQLVAGAQEAQFGGVSKATATESAIAANATNASDGASIDDLDNFLTTIARASGQILQREMSEDKVKEIVGAGAFWPEVTLKEVATEVFLEVEAGSTGKPNQAIEVANLQKLLPMLMQMPGINPTWLAKETLRRLDDRLDLNQALADNIPSIASMNQNTQMTAAPPQDDPNLQGSEGGANGAKPAREPGSDAAFGSNQTEPTPTSSM